ncbi:hypothetical protein BK004_02790 [bacterium CG10_46_32]|nr:MAG: hypothetical protein BK004_02790 [bacterium CG10_46_32]PIQ91491.1 MAG: hypothetical protein COV70_03405 [Parcubacteria group bacterium CG11_big_fil_rev_8_21_14_0_20_39_22]PIR56071.1 MAG: hypothetical protein COU73_02820 [Parcubacteria group bacterium CG10_big_fil_rev_8_21_14_0_10_46_32]
METISKHLVEIRYKPNSRFLDKRGEVADLLSNSIFDQWNISTNKINFSSKKDDNIEAFFSFRNLGLFTNYPNTQDFFLEKAKDFIKSAWNYFPTGNIIRVGVRSTYLFETRDFKNTFDKYRSKFLALSDEDIKEFDGDLIDLGFPLNFSIGEDFFNVNTGPMEKDQSKEMVLNDEEELPTTGVYIDVDYFRKEFSPHTTQKNILEFVDKGIQKADKISKLIAGWTTKK